MPFTCTICGEESTHICVWCTKDTCANHLCAKCGRCSDCCECEVPLEEPVFAVPTVHDAIVAQEMAATVAAPVEEPPPIEEPPPADQVPPVKEPEPEPAPEPLPALPEV